MMISSVKVVNVPSGSINTEATIYTPTSGKRFRLLGGSLQCSVAGAAILKDGTGGTSMATIGCDVAYKAVPFTFKPAGADDHLNSGYLSAAADNVITAQGINGNLSGYLLVIEE